MTTGTVLNSVQRTQFVVFFSRLYKNMDQVKIKIFCIFINWLKLQMLLIRHHAYRVARPCSKILNLSPPAFFFSSIKLIKLARTQTFHCEEILHNIFLWVGSVECLVGLKKPNLSIVNNFFIDKATDLKFIYSKSLWKIEVIRCFCQK